MAVEDYKRPVVATDQYQFVAVAPLTVEDQYGAVVALEVKDHKPLLLAVADYLKTMARVTTVDNVIVEAALIVHHGHRHEKTITLKDYRTWTMMEDPSWDSQPTDSNSTQHARRQGVT